MSKPPRCPLCNSAGKRRLDGDYQCTGCGGLYDGDPDEGGDYHSRDVARRMEREESRRERRRARR